MDPYLATVVFTMSVNQTTYCITTNENIIKKEYIKCVTFLSIL